MGLEIKLDFPHFEKGLEMEVGGLLLKNGQTTKLTDEQEQDFVARNGGAVKDVLENNEYVTVSGTATMTPAKVEAQGGGEG